MRLFPADRGSNYRPPRRRPVTGRAVAWGRGEPMLRATIHPDAERTGAAERLEEAQQPQRLTVDHDEAPRQELLPPLRWLLQPNDDRFAHPAEIEVARLLTFYGLRWAYEPTTFAVRWGRDGRPVEFVTPDFYLPEHDLYLELTTMRQRLVTRKNRKFRLLRETYPNVRVRMLYLRDFQRLRDVYGPSRAEREARISGILYDEQDVETRIAQLAHQLIQAWYGRAASERGQRPLLVGVGSGSDRFLTSLGENLRGLGVPVDLDRVALTSIGADSGSSRVRVCRPPAATLTGRSVTLVQEVLSTGLSATFLSGWLRRHGASSVETCALLDREAARVVDVPVVCRGFAVPDVVLAGFGLARRNQFRDLPYIAKIETD
ncbi:MAG: hpt1 [Thermomicrobiales bacterium]|nr:hpt1 [Thermomicrobiales bacterium]